MMEHCRMITFEELQELRRHKEAFRPFPVWVEANLRYYDHPVCWMPLAPAIFQTIYDEPEEEDVEVYIEGGGTFEWLAYGISWRLWYACGAERPACDVPWKRFSWDHGKGDHA